jgi:uncharacterized protein
MVSPDSMGTACPPSGRNSTYLSVQISETSSEFHKGEWASLLADEEHGGWLVPIFALANEHSPDPDMRPYKEPVSTELREKLIVGAAAGVTGIYRHFKTQRSLEKELYGNATTFRRSMPKVGRNDPCPCGSGKKFKQCCGQPTLH